MALKTQENAWKTQFNVIFQLVVFYNAFNKYIDFETPLFWKPLLKVCCGAVTINYIKKYGITAKFFATIQVDTIIYFVYV